MRIKLLSFLVLLLIAMPLCSFGQTAKPVTDPIYCTYKAGNALFNCCGVYFYQENERCVYDGLAWSVCECPFEWTFYCDHEVWGCNKTFEIKSCYTQSCNGPFLVPLTAKDGFGNEKALVWVKGGPPAKQFSFKINNTDPDSPLIEGMNDGNKDSVTAARKKLPSNFIGSVIVIVKSTPPVLRKLTEAADDILVIVD